MYNMDIPPLLHICQVVRQLVTENLVNMAEYI